MSETKGLGNRLIIFQSFLIVLIIIDFNLIVDSEF